MVTRLNSRRFIPDLPSILLLRRCFRSGTCCRVLLYWLYTAVCLTGQSSWCAELVDTRPDSSERFWQYQISFNESPGHYRAYDRIDSDGYFYLDFYNVLPPGENQPIQIRSDYIRHVKQLYYDRGKVLRFVFYTRGPVNCIVSLSESGDYTVRVFSTGGPLRLLNPPVSWRMRKVVIDPGHGGSGNLGARTSIKIKNRHVYEKELTLKIARFLEQYLDQSDYLIGIPTRMDDRFVSLSDRVEFSNIVGGDVFVSLHLNASPSRKKTARGFEVYYLSERGADREVNRYLLRLENDMMDDKPLDDVEDDLLQKILKDETSGLMQTRRMESRKVCEFISNRFRKGGPFRKYHRGTKSAPFRVLKNIYMPAVLVECGFIDHPSDASHLVKPSVQKNIAALIYNGMNRYFDKVDPEFQARWIK
jgi:N-acetylmuramoyl-L-alanine amidase